VFGTAFTLGGGFQGWINRFVSDGAAYPFMVPVLRQFVLPHGTAIAFLVAFGEFAIGLALCFGVLTRIASIWGLIYMLTLLVSSNYPGAHVAAWQYFGASLDHLVLALCFAAFVVGDPDQALSVSAYLRRRSRSLPATTN
jgi:thiosulfate dehydrogenase [quinone] large subunit